MGVEIKIPHYIVFFSIPISVGLLVNAPEFVMVFSGVQFVEAITAMQMMAFLPFFIGLGYFFAFQILVPLGKNKEMLYAVLVVMVLSLLSAPANTIRNVFLFLLYSEIKDSSSFSRSAGFGLRLICSLIIPIIRTSLIRKLYQSPMCLAI